MEARAIQRTVRQSARKMRLVIDQIRGRAVPEAYAILRFSKKLAAKQIHKVLKSAVANAEQRAQRENAALDVDAPAETRAPKAAPAKPADAKAEGIARPVKAGGAGKAKGKRPKANKAGTSKKKKESR